MSEFPGEMMAAMPPNAPRRPFSEKKMSDETLASWETTDLPDAAAVEHVSLIPYRGERVVLAWRDGKLALPEGAVAPGESIDAAIRRIAEEQAGILNLTWLHLGQLRCRATTYSKTVEAGTITYRAIYGVEVGGLADFPSAPGFERRTVLQRDLLVVLRERYNEFSLEYTDALDRFIIHRVKKARV
jgi:hypothetical protein